MLGVVATDPPGKHFARARRGREAVLLRDSGSTSLQSSGGDGVGSVVSTNAGEDLGVVFTVTVDLG